MIPEAFSEKFRRLLGAEYADFAASFSKPRSVGLRVNPKKRADLSAFHLTPVPWAETGFYYDPDTRPGLSAYHDAGAYYLQEPSAMAPAELLDAKPGQRVLDLCAAPGGKTTQIAAKLAGSGILIANEIHPQRVKILSRNVERMGIANAIVLNEAPAKLAGRFPEWFDRILVDAPCSGEGMFLKEPAAAEDWSDETVSMCAERQYEILCHAAAMLAGGGRLVYSTCTFSPEENEGVISRFLKSHPEFSLPERLPLFAPGRPEWVEAPAPGLERTYRLWPHKLRGAGHFAAVLEKRGGARSELPAQRNSSLPKELTALLAELGADLPDGIPLSFGENWYLAPTETPELSGLKVLRAGLALGQARKGYALPDHALALWLQTALRTADFPADSAEIASYLRGEAIRGAQSGWTLITADGLSLGWAKGSGGILKNHFPKGLRRKE